MKHVVGNQLRLLLLLLLFSPSRGFVPTLAMRPVGCTATTTTSSTTAIDTAKMDGIAHELEELGQEIQPHVFPVKHGFNEFKESLVHKLRHAVYEKDKLVHEALKELEQYHLQHDDPIETSLLTTLRDIQHMLQEEPWVFEYAWRSAQLELENGLKQLDPEQQDTGYTFLNLVQTLERIEQELIASREQKIKVEAAKALGTKSKSEDDDSVTRLLWRALKLTGRRIKNAVGFVLCFGRKRNARKE